MVKTPYRREFWDSIEFYDIQRLLGGIEGALTMADMRVRAQEAQGHLQHRWLPAGDIGPFSMACMGPSLEFDVASG